MQLQVCLSNRVERLYGHLKERLFAHPSAPFAKRFIVVPSPALKTWLMARMADDPDLQIAAGVEITHLEGAIASIVDRYAVDPGSFPRRRSSLELSLRLEAEIKGVLSTCKTLTPDDENLWQPLVGYLRPDTGHIAKRKIERRILALSDQLANLFMLYGKYGTTMLREWQKNPKIHWQAMLWNRIIGETMPEQTLWKCANAAVHLFAMSFIPKQTHLLLKQLSQTLSVHYYLLSPCHVFWSDILSDKECRRLMVSWREKGAREAQQLALDELIYERNALLANFGRVGREMAQQIEACGCATVENYVIQEAFTKIPQYAPLLTGDLSCNESNSLPTLLEALQTDLLLMRSPSRDDLIHLSFDGSVQLHAAPTPWREVEALYDTLMRILEESCAKGVPVQPGEILVMAPDIASYEPYIHAVFGSPESCLDYKMMDVDLVSQNSLVQAFLSLLALPYGRWDAAVVLQLFSHPAFHKKQGWTLEDVVKIRSWIDSSGIRWGDDPKHREHLLRRDHGEVTLFDKSGGGTWSDGIDRVVLGLAVESPPEGVETCFYPAANVDTAQADLLGRWIAIMRALRSDLAVLVGDTEMTLQAWADTLESLFEAYLYVDTANAEGEEKIRGVLAQLRRAAQAAPQSYPLSTVKHHVEALLKRDSAAYREGHLHAVRFCSMLPMRAVPAKVIALLGMAEGCYPRKEKSQSLNLLRENPSADYSPTQLEFDRYLFLEALLSARENFVMIYSSASQDDGKEQPSSLLATELFGYLDSGYTVDGGLPSERCLVNHPLRAYDKAYFSKEGQLKTYSEEHYRAACAYYLKEKRPLHSFVPEFFYVKQSPSSASEETVEVRQLAKFAKNPLRAYFNNRLGLYIDNPEEKKVKTEEDFHFSFLDNAVLRKALLKSSGESVESIAARTGALPQGPFKEHALKNLTNDVVECRESLAKYGVSAETLFRIELSEKHKEPYLSEAGTWKLPPLPCTVAGRNVTIVGHLDDISEAGYVIFKECKDTILVQHWPQYLVFHAAISRYGLRINPHLIFAKKGARKDPLADDPTKELEAYLQYYFAGMESPSPLIPEWVSLIVKNDADALQKAASEIQSGKSDFFFNDDAAWLWHGSPAPDAASITRIWSPIACEVFGSIFENRKPSKTTGKTDAL